MRKMTGPAWRRWCAAAAVVAAIVVVGVIMLTHSDPADSPKPAPNLFAEFTASNGRTLEYHHFDNGDRGTLFYFDGDGATSFHYPDIDAELVSDSPDRDGYVQRLNTAAAAHGMDFVFVEHPDGMHGGESWWADMTDETINEYAVAVQELITACEHRAVQLVGYSGGSEFIVRHLLVNGNEWLPTNSAAAMIGGGGLDGYHLEAPAPERTDMPYRWFVGEHDVEGATEPENWSALQASRDAQSHFAALGYEAAEIIVIADTNHLDYDFEAIIDGELDQLAGQDAA